MIKLAEFDCRVLRITEDEIITSAIGPKTRKEYSMGFSPGRFKNPQVGQQYHVQVIRDDQEHVTMKITKKRRKKISPEEAEQNWKMLEEKFGDYSGDDDY
jgi:hypothetical protein